MTARTSAILPASLQSAVDAQVADWKSGRKVERLWASDAKLWTGADEASWTGWLSIVDEQCGDIARFQQILADAKSPGPDGSRPAFEHVCLLGMGGSSLGPEVWSTTFGRQPGAPELVVLDSTDPQQLLATERKLDLTRTLFCVSSKSGSTLEPNIFKAHFFERVKEIFGAAEAGRRFVAITDPGSQMERVAKQDGFRRIHHGVKSIGGRYSALSGFGLVPAAMMGLDVGKLLERAHAMKEACRKSDPADNPGVLLGLILGCAGRSGRDKITIVTSKSVLDLGAWIEQLVAESTGKNGRGLIPVDRERLGPPSSYGEDRLFLSFEVEGDENSANEKALAALERAGQPVVRVPMGDAYDLAGEFFRLEIATAVTGSLLGINPFDQPDVEASKLATRALTSAYEESGGLPPEKPFHEEPGQGKGMKLFADEKNAAELVKAAGAKPTLARLLRAQVDRLRPGDYAALLAYVDMNATHESLLQSMRHAVRDRRKVATCLGFGPRFLHSTGQAYKGGPNRGVFLQITCDDARDVPVPGAKYTFGVVKAAQARGDFSVLAERGRRALRVHLGPDVAGGLAQLARVLEEALS